MSAADRLQQPGTLRASWVPTASRRPAVKVTSAYGGSYGSYFPHYRVPTPGDDAATTTRPAVPRTSGPLQPRRGPSTAAPLPTAAGMPAPAAAPTLASGDDEYAALLAALKQDRDRAVALAGELWRQLGIMALALTATWPKVVAASEGAAAAATARLPELQAAAANGLGLVQESIGTVATSGEARAAALAAAANTVAGISRALGSRAHSSSVAAASTWESASAALLEGGRTTSAAAAAAMAPLVARAHAAAVAALALLRGAWSGGTPVQQALGQSALIGTLLMHIPLVGGLAGRGRRQQKEQKSATPAPYKWEVARVAARGGEAGGPVVLAGRYAQAASRDLQHCVVEPVTRAGATFYAANRGTTLLVGGAAVLLLALAALRRMVELSAARAEERVMRQLELQRRAEELASVRNRIRGALDASEPDRESRQSRQAALAAEVEEDIGTGGPLSGAAVRGRGRGAAPGGTGAVSRGAARSNSAEQEAVKRFQAFVAASGMGEVVRARDGRMWEAARDEGPTASREAVDRATAAFRSLGPSSADALEADRADAQRQLEEQMAELAEISGGAMGRAAREAAKQQRLSGDATASGADKSAAAPRGGYRGGGGGDNPFALSAEEKARWEAEDGQYTEGAAARRAPRRRASGPPPPPPVEQRRALQQLEAAKPVVTEAGAEGDAAPALAASVRGRLGLAGGSRGEGIEDETPPMSPASGALPSGPAQAQEDGAKESEQPPASVAAPTTASIAPAEKKEDSPEEWAKARSEMMASGQARRARREAAMAAARKGKAGPAAAATAQPGATAAAVEAEATGAAAAAAAAVAAGAASRDLSGITAPPPPTAAEAAAVAPTPAVPASKTTSSALSAAVSAAAAAPTASGAAPADGNPFAVDPAVLQADRTEDGGPDDPHMYQGMRIVRRGP